jgi:hypothetical protein
MTTAASIAILTGVTMPAGFCGPFLSTRSMIFIPQLFHDVGTGTRGGAVVQRMELKSGSRHCCEHCHSGDAHSQWFTLRNLERLAIR